MTLSELNNLSDEEVNRRVTEIMGGKPVHLGWIAFNPETKGIAFQGDCKADVERWIGDGYGRNKTYIAKEDLMWPDYLHIADAAITLCDKMREEGWGVNLWASSDGPWQVRVTKYKQFQISLPPKAVTATAPSLPRAITLAFLMAKLNGN